MKTREIIVALMAMGDFLLAYFFYDAGCLLYAMNTLMFFIGSFILYSIILGLLTIEL